MIERFPHGSQARPTLPTSNIQHPHAAVLEILFSESQMTVRFHQLYALQLLGIAVVLYCQRSYNYRHFHVVICGVQYCNAANCMYTGFLYHQ